jgi:hypothetical protein
MRRVLPALLHTVLPVPFLLTKVRPTLLINTWRGDGLVQGLPRFGILH